MMEVLRWILLVVIVLLFCSMLALPIVAVVMLQNWQRRRHTRALATTFGLEVDLDPASRFTRATPSARGMLDGRRIVIRAEASRDIFYTVGAGIHSRADLGRVTVSAPSREDDLILRVSPCKASGAGGAPGIALALSSEEDPDRAPWLTEAVRAHLADHQRRFDKRFSVAWLATGLLSAPTPALFTKRIARLTEDRVRLLLRLSEAMHAPQNEPTT